MARALDVLGRGGLLVYPTDTLYALGGRALDPSSVTRVQTAKGRPDGKPFPVIAADLEQVHRLARLSGLAECLSARLWPGPLTLVLEGRSGLPGKLLSTDGTLAVRVPALRLARELCAEGPLVATSANRSGQPSPSTCAAAVAAVGSAAQLALDAGPGRREASTIVDATGASPVLLRAGALTWEQVLATCGSLAT